MVDNRMLAGLRVRITQYGDVVYFTASERVWTRSIQPKYSCDLADKSTVKNPLTCMFRIDAADETRSTALKGKPVLPGASLGLIYCLLEKRIGWSTEGLVRQIQLPNDDSKTEIPTISFLVSTQRPNISLGVVDQDLVTVRVNGQSHGGVLGHDFYVKGDEGDKWVIHRFEEYSKEDNELRFGRPYKLKASDGLYLSVLPSPQHSASLIIPEELQSKEAETFPEYFEDLRADLTSDQYDANNVWIMENTDRYLGGVIHSGEPFFLKHLGSNKYLSQAVTLVAKDQATPMTLQSLDEGHHERSSLCYGEFADLTNADGCIVSQDLTPSYELCKTQLFGDSLASLPLSTVVRHGLQSGVTESVVKTLKFEAQYISQSFNEDLLWLATKIAPLVKLRTALQRENAQREELECLAQLADLPMLKNISKAKDIHLGSILGDFQFQKELFRIYFLARKYYERTKSYLSFHDNLWNICINWQYFEPVKRSLLSHKETFLAFLKADPAYFAEILKWGVRTYPPNDDTRRHWLEYFARPDYTTLSLFNLSDPDISNLFNEVASRLSSPFSNADWLINDEELGNCLDGKTLKAFPTLGSGLQSRAMQFVFALAANLAQTQSIKAVMTDKLGLTTETVLANYRATDNIQFKLSFLLYIAKVVVHEECGPSTISEFTENLLVDWAKLSEISPHPSHWFFLSSPDSPIQELVKDEVYFWLSANHTCSKDKINVFYQLACAHMRFVEQLLEHNAVSDIFVASMMLATAALARFVLNQPITGFVTRFPKLQDYTYRHAPFEQEFLENFLELVDTYQRWKKLKVLQRIADLGSTTVNQLQTYLRELTFPAIIEKHMESAGLATDSLSPDSPLLEALKVLATSPLCQLEDLLIYLFKETQYQCKRRPEYILELIDREVDMSRHLCHHFQRLVDAAPYSDLIFIVKALFDHDFSSYELERKSAKDVGGFEPFVGRMSELSKLSYSQADSNNLRTFLEKLNFERILETLWFNCTIIGSDFLEDSLYIEFRSLVFSLTRFFITNNPANRKKVLSILPISAFFPDYPEYILLLRELGLLESLKDCMRVGLAVLSFAGTCEGRRPVLALKVLLQDSKYTAEVALALVSAFRTNPKESLTGAEWEALALVCSFLSRQERAILLKKVLEKWSENKEFAVKAEMVRLLILSGEEWSGHAAEALTILGPFFNSPNKQQICTIFSLFNQENGRSAEKTSDNEAFILETIWSPDMITFLGRDPTFCHYLISLFHIISPDPALAGLSSIFQSQVTALMNMNKDELLAELQQCAAVSLPSKPSVHSALQCPPVKPLFQVSLEQSSDSINVPRKSLHETLLKELEIRTLVYEENDKKHQKPPGVIYSCKPEVFEQFQKWFLEKKIEMGYLLTCQIAGNMLNPEECDKQNTALTRVIEEFLSLAIHRDQEVMKQAVEALIVIVLKVESTREFVLEALKKRRRYLQAFGYLQYLMRERSNLCEMIENGERGNKAFHIEKLKSLNSAIEAYLRLFQCCCDGCYSPFQDFLRDQGDLTSINIISLTAELLAETVIVQIDSETKLRETACLMLVEALTGPNSINQQTVCNTEGFLETVQKQVKAAESVSDIKADIWKETGNLLKLVFVLLEGRERNWQAIQEVMPSFDFDIFRQLAVKKAQSLDETALRSICLGFNTEEQKGEFDFAILCLQICFLAVKDLKDFSEIPLTKFLAMVEIQESDTSIRCISFPVPPFCHFLTSETALKLLFEIDRESRQVKLNDFTSKLQICEEEIRHQKGISQIKVLKGVTKYWKRYWQLAFFLVVLINIVLILAVVPSEESRFNIETEWLWTLTILSALQVLCSFLGIISYYIEYPYILTSLSKKREQTNEIEELPNQDSPGSVNAHLILCKEKKAGTYNWREVLKALLRLVILALACAAEWYPYLYPILLFQIVNLNDSAVTILRSVTERWSQLVLTFLFALIIIYGFTVVAYFFLYSYYNSEEGLYCDSLLDCFLSTVNLGMRSGGGIGDAYGPTQLSDFHLRWMFDLLFFILIITILMAIVFGIIVDTFSELRDESNAREFDMNNICFICGKSRSVIELKGEGWQTHTLFTHNPFAYLYFLIYIRGKKSNDCTGIEKTIQEQLKADDLSFYPATSRQLGFDLD